jgi:hypothetical protein
MQGRQNCAIFVLEKDKIFIFWGSEKVKMVQFCFYRNKADKNAQ